QRALYTLAALLAVGVILTWRVDINEFSMNHFYRNRLVRCYLGPARERRNADLFTNFDFNDDFPISELQTSFSYAGPYAIINTTLNVSRGGDLDVQDRKAESFFISPLYC